MYAVNASIPKTLVRHLVRYEAMHGNDELRRVLLDILDTPVSPELLPPKTAKFHRRRKTLWGRMNCMITICIICCALGLLRVKFMPDGAALICGAV